MGRGVFQIIKLRGNSITFPNFFYLTVSQTQRHLNPNHTIPSDIKNELSLQTDQNSEVLTIYLSIIYTKIAASVPPRDTIIIW